jgi:hypothetical protein
MVFALLVSAGLADAVFLGGQHHGEFWWSHVYGFYALFGLLGCLAMILFAKQVLARWLQREEDYYGKGRSA